MTIKTIYNILTIKNNESLFLNKIVIIAIKNKIGFKTNMCTKLHNISDYPWILKKSGFTQ